MVNMNYYLDRKYDALETQARAAETEANARAGLLGQQAAATPALTEGTVAKDKAAASLGQAQAQETPGLSRAEQAQRYGAGALGQAQAQDVSSYQQPASGSFLEQIRRLTSSGQSVPQTGLPTLSLTPTLSSPEFQTPVAPGAPQAQQPQGSTPRNYATGTDRVPGKGSGKKDTQKAMLAPGEAVLNKAAAEHLGRHTIALLNALGEQKMGMTGDTQEGVGATDQGTTQGYAKGTAKVPAKAPAKKADASAKSKGQGDDHPTISPQLLAALMQMGGGPGAGGMPVPGGAPMPMPMPQTGGPA